MTFLTDFADQAVVLPAVAAVGLLLLLFGWRRGALGWIGGIGVTLGLMLLLKLLFLACGAALPEAGIRTPSGHAAAAAALAGGVAAVLGARRRGVLGAALLAALAIGGTRLALGVHSVPEVLLGGAVGTGGAALLARWAGPPPRRVPRSALLATLAAVVLACHGRHLPAEPQIGRAAALLHVWPLAACAPPR